MKNSILFLLILPVIASAQPDVTSYESTFNDCMKPQIKLALDEKPISLSNNVKGILTVPSITDKRAKAQDFLVFHHRGLCYQIASGIYGNNFENIIKTANRIIEKKP